MDSSGSPELGARVTHPKDPTVKVDRLWFTSNIAATNFAVQKTMIALSNVMNVLPSIYVLCEHSKWWPCNKIKKCGGKS